MKSFLYNKIVNFPHIIFLTNLSLITLIKLKFFFFLLSRWFVESQTEILVLTNFTFLVCFFFNQFYIFGYSQLFTTMFKLLVILFIIKMYARNNIFKLIKVFLFFFNTSSGFFFQFEVCIINCFHA